MNGNNLPPYRIDVCVPERREPGMMVFNVRPGGSNDLAGNVGWIIGMDHAGEFALNLQYDTPCQDACALTNGNLMFSLPGAGLIKEVTRSGKEVRQWHAAGKWADKTPPAGSIELDIPLFHHRISVFPNGNLLVMSAELRELADWPKRDDDPNSPRHTARVVGDVFLEVSPDGKIVNCWKMLDLLDPYRLSYGSCSGYWNRRGFPDSNDWCHANAVIYDPADDCLMASLRTQDCIIKFSRSTGELKWILGDHGNWRAPWSEKLLKPDDSVAWQYHQHDCSVTPTGTILCFDNGNNRATPFRKKIPPEKNFSRIVEFSVDEEAMRVSQAWSFGEDPDQQIFACFQGGAYRLPKTGNTFMTYGGICTIDGVPTDNNQTGFCRSRLLEVTPDGEIVFDMWVDSSDEAEPRPLSSFRAEFLPNAGAEK